MFARDAAVERLREKVLVAAIAGSSTLAWLALWRWGKPFAKALGLALLIAGVSFSFWPSG